MAAVLLIAVLLFSGCSQEVGQLASEELARIAAENSAQKTAEAAEPSREAGTIVAIDSIPAYSGEAYIAIGNNQPTFSEEELSRQAFEQYSPLDALGRCGTAYANIGTELMPSEKRGSIGQVKPTGWQTVKYDNVDGKYLYNRCHLIGYQLTAENANERNLITGTRYLNVKGMLPFENLVADYIKETGNHVLYRVTPVYDGDNLLASGVLMEGYSVEDRGDGVCFYVYAYNVQPGIQIDYASGYSKLIEDSDASDYLGQAEEAEIRGNSRSKVYHSPGQSAYGEMEESKYLVVFHSEEEALDAGYRKAKR
ncbi:DNA/RNA non-specific endonuclease [Aminipila butyrica]|uniref:DNA/RNA non-specific endonuclease n=2 Tax=Aminipila butyrica TaxID=433296 RepID=A0A858C0X4_9FIRM|nr:DNA/RNA non-specific endonuclease [Aminipila butyrica]